MPNRFATSIAIAMIVALGARASAQRAEHLTWKIEGEQRRAILYPPSVDSPGGRSPLVFSFHGHGDTIQNFENTDMHGAWPEAIVVYFQGLPASDGLPGWQAEKGVNHDRDLKLVDAAVASVSREFSVDKTRIYATGFSNGANFTYLLWAERPDVFAAFAPVAARLQPSIRPTQPRPIFHIAGQRDTRIPIAEQNAAIEIAKLVNGTAAPVMTWIHPGGHVYPGPASDRIAKFFRDHPGKKP